MIARTFLLSSGPIWGSKKTKKVSGGVREMASAFTEMANSIASAFQLAT